MAQRVTISTLAPLAPLAAHFDWQRLASEMVSEHWQPQFAQVLPDRPDLIVLPEMCDFYGNFTVEQILEYQAQRGSAMETYLRSVAAENHCYITFPTLRTLDDGNLRNSVVLIDRHGETAGIYDKNHVVIDETTRLGIYCGHEAPVFECDFGRVACAICFDLNFDALRLQYMHSKPDLILFSSVYHGGLVQNYWAYSCRAHFASAVAGLPSGIISPAGQNLATTTNYTQYVTSTVNLDCCLAHLDYNRDKMQTMKKHYGSEVTLHDPGYLGSILITSESETHSIDDMLLQFDIEPLDAYFERALCHHKRNGGDRYTP